MISINFTVPLALKIRQKRWHTSDHCHRTHHQSYLHVRNQSHLYDLQ